MSQDGQQHIVVEDYLEGEVITEARGQAGFGYDPVFFFLMKVKLWRSCHLQTKYQS